MTVLIRLARPSDAALLPEVERSAAGRFREIPDLAWISDDAVLPADTHERFIAGGAEWVAEDLVDGIAGFLVAEPMGDDLHIWELAVRLDRQGQGIGGGLIEAAAAHAHAAGLTALTLTTFRDVAWNEAFYARRGFQRLKGAALDDRLAAILAREITLGLPGDRRCAMRCDTA